MASPPTPKPPEPTPEPPPTPKPPEPLKVGGVEPPLPPLERRPPAKQPAPLPAPPAPSVPAPPGTPSVEGEIGDLLALDGERAVIRFFVPGPEHAKQWWLALLRRDGSVGWARERSGQLAFGHGAAFTRVGDAVVLGTTTMVGDEPRVTLAGHALADGAPRFQTELGPGSFGETRVAGELRYDTRVHYVFEGGARVEAELTACSATGVVWRAPIGPPIPVGHDPTVVGDAVAVRVEEDRGPTRWLVFDGATGTKRGDLEAAPQSCSDGRRWFVLGAQGLLAVDAVKVTTRLAMPPPTTPSGSGAWVIEDCTFAGDSVVALVGRGRRKALVAIDPDTFAARGQLEVGTAAIGFDGFDPLPERGPRVLTLRTMTAEGEDELLLVEPAASRLVGRWRGRDELTTMFLVGALPWRGGMVFTTGKTLAVITESGELEGRAAVAQMEAWSPGQSVPEGEHVWLPPSGPLRLGTRAPQVVSLAAPVSEAVRDAVLAEVERPPADAPGKGKRPCPDPREVFRGDGLGTTAPLGPVAKTQLPAWDLEILAETARTLACAPGEAPARLLAWYVMEDDRPLRNDNALLLVEDATSKPPRFTLVQVYRHAKNHEWNTIGSFHDPSEPVRTFDHRPTRAEIDAFLAQSGWDFADAWGRVIAGNVIDAEWLAATGEAPWRSYAAGIERPD